MLSGPLDLLASSPVHSFATSSSVQCKSLIEYSVYRDEGGTLESSTCSLNADWKNVLNISALASGNSLCGCYIQYCLVNSRYQHVTSQRTRTSWD